MEEENEEARGPEETPGTLQEYDNPRVSHLRQIKSALELEGLVCPQVDQEVTRLNQEKVRSISRVDGRVSEQKKDVVLDIRRWKLNKKKKELEDEIKLMRARENILTKKEYEE